MSGKSRLLKTILLIHIEIGVEWLICNNKKLHNIQSEKYVFSEKDRPKTDLRFLLYYPFNWLSLNNAGYLGLVS